MTSCSHLKIDELWINVLHSLDCGVVTTLMVRHSSRVVEEHWTGFPVCGTTSWWRHTSSSGWRCGSVVTGETTSNGSAAGVKTAELDSLCVDDEVGQFSRDILLFARFHLKSRHLERTCTVVRTQRDVITRTFAAGGSRRLLFARAHRVKRLAACTERVKPSTCCTTYAQKVMK